MLEEAEKFKDDDVHVGNIVRASVWEQFTRAISELRDRIVKFLDLLENDVYLLKSRFGVPLSVGFDCRRQLVQSLLYPLLLIWLPITVVMAIRGDLKTQFETRLYVFTPPHPPPSPPPRNQLPSATPSPRCGSRHCTRPPLRCCPSSAWRSVFSGCSTGALPS